MRVRPPRLVHGWWSRRGLLFRITVLTTTVASLCLVPIASLGSVSIGALLVDAADHTMGADLRAASAEVTSGAMPSATAADGVRVRILDRAGQPLDGAPRPELDQTEIVALESGQAVLRNVTDPPWRWLGTVVTAPHGDQVLVAVGAPLVGYQRARRMAWGYAVAAVLLGGLVAGAATWLAARTSLRPLRTMRAAAAALSPGTWLPLPAARDELHALAESVNELLARRDEARRRLQRFTGDAAHELRSPVASIRSQAEVAVLHPDPALAHDVLADIVAESERLSKLIDDLLVLSRSDAGELPAAGLVDVALAAQAAVNRLPAEAPRTRLDVPTRSCPVWAAPGEVDLVLDNLLRNAAAHARARVTVSVLPASGGAVRLLVDDDGPGVPVEHQDRIFDRFYRVEDDRARSSGGFGLGLALVAEVVRRRGGGVSVGESPEGGARFTVRWPGTAARN